MARESPLLQDDGGAGGSAGHNRKLLLVESRRGLWVTLCMRVHWCGRRQRQPLIERYVGVIAALEQLQEAHRRGSGVLDIMRHCKRHVADIAGLKVEGTRLA